VSEPVFSWVDHDLLSPNNYNPNVMDGEMFAKAVESIHRFGFVDPVTVRELGERFEIVDGEHRWRAAMHHSGSCTKVKGKYVEHVGLRQIAIASLGEIDDTSAKQLTIVLNETRGEYDPKKMGAVLTSLVAGESMPALLELLPFTPDQFAELAELPKVDWGTIAPRAPVHSRTEKWVERVYRLPVEAATKLDEAVAKARTDGSSADWRCLQVIAEHFLSSYGS
jgi:hypothetical protein